MDYVEFETLVYQLPGIVLFDYSCIGEKWTLREVGEIMNIFWYWTTRNHPFPLRWEEIKTEGEGLLFLFLPPEFLHHTMYSRFLKKDYWKNT